MPKSTITLIGYFFDYSNGYVKILFVDSYENVTSYQKKRRDFTLNYLKKKSAIMKCNSPVSFNNGCFYIKYKIKKGTGYKFADAINKLGDKVPIEDLKNKIVDCDVIFKSYLFDKNNGNINKGWYLELKEMREV